MNIRAVVRIIGRVTWMEAICMLPAMVLCFIQRDQNDAIAFAVTIGLLAVFGALTLLVRKKPGQGIGVREGFASVALGWIIISLFGALPFYFSGAIPGFINCVFETVSGFTTTGASVVADVEAMADGILYWRAFTNWLGGMGVLVFMLAIVPMTNKGSGDTFYLLRAESPGPVISKLVPKMRSSARLLYLMYLGLTVLLIILLVAGGMPLFDSICHAFSTAGTGGFSNKNASIGAYNSYYLQTVISVFMMLFGVNFGVYFLLLARDFRGVLKSEEIRLYFIIIAAATLVVGVNIYNQFGNVHDTLHHAFFQVSSIITTTGFSSVNFDLWPQLSKTLLLLLMICGACAGSTGGGFKVSRLVILWKSARHELQRILHPRAVRVMKLDGRILDDSVVTGVGGYLVMYILLCVVSMLIVSADSPSFLSTFSSVISCINNIGPGLDVVGPTGNYAHFSALTKVVLSADMLIGRLEIYPMLLIFMPSVWRRGQ